MLEQQPGESLSLAGVPADENTPFSTTIKERFLRDGYPVAFLGVDVNWPLIAKASHESMLHAEMLLLFVFMAVVVVSLVVTGTFVKLPLLRLERAIEYPEEDISSNGG